MQKKAKCRKCGTEVTLDAPDDIMEYISAHASTLLNAALCAKCGEAVAQRDRDIDAEAAMVRRTDRKKWEDICPQECLDTDPAKLQPDARTPFRKCAAWKYGKTGLLMYGPTGKGKTRAAWWVMKNMHEERRSYIAITASEFAMDCATAAMQSTHQASAWIKKIKSVEVLFIDDIGKRLMTDFAEGVFHDALSHRCAHHKPLIVTAEGDRKWLLGRFSADRREAIIRRLVQHCQPVFFGAPLNY